MGVKFAGSRSVDDRRRRRLASDQETLTQSSTVKHPQAGYLKIRRYEPNATEPPRSPIGSLITPGHWPIWSVCLSLPVLLLVLSAIPAVVRLPADSAVQLILDAETGHAWRFLRGLILLGCAGLCWLISWFRSASVNDFEGCFKSWYWSGWIFLLLGLIAGTDTHVILGQLASQYVGFGQANFSALLWLVPLLSLLGEPFRCFTREMWHCRRSWIGLWACCVTGIFYLWARLEGGHTAGQVSANTQMQLAAICSLVAPAWLFSALLSQVHYVMYVSSDPVPKRSSWLISGSISGVKRTWQGGMALLSGVSGFCLSGWSRGAEWRELRRMATAEKRELRLKEREKQQQEKAAAREKLAAEKEAKAAQLKEQKQQQDQQKSDAAQKKAEAAQQKAEAARLKAEAAAQKKAEAAQLKAEAAQLKAEAAAKKQAEAAAKPKPERTRTTAKAAVEADTQTETDEGMSTSAATSKAAKTAAVKKTAAAKTAPEPERDAEPVVEKPRIRLKPKPVAQPVVKASKPVVPESESEDDQASGAGQSWGEAAWEEELQAQAAAAIKMPEPKPVASEPVNSDWQDEEEGWDQEDGDKMDPEALKGLSKKERRKLRKLHRDQQRAKAG